MSLLVEPPRINIPKLTEEEIKSRKLNKNDPIYKKYVQPIIDRQKKLRRAKRREWWSSNWIALSGLLVAVIALAVSTIALLR